MGTGITTKDRLSYANSPQPDCAMETRRRVLGTEYPEMSDILHNLALTMKWQDRDEVVTALMEEYVVLEGVLGPTIPLRLPHAKLGLSRNQRSRSWGRH